MTASCAPGDGPAARGSNEIAPAIASTARDAVTLRGPVTQTYGPYVFAVGSGSERVVVVAAPAVAVGVGTTVEVTGRARTFRRDELEEALGGGVVLGPETDELEGASCVVATSVEVQDR